MAGRPAWTSGRVPASPTRLDRGHELKGTRSCSRRVNRSLCGLNRAYTSAPQERRGLGVAAEKAEAVLQGGSGRTGRKWGRAARRGRRRAARLRGAARADRPGPRARLPDLRGDLRRRSRRSRSPRSRCSDLHAHLIEHGVDVIADDGVTRLQGGQGRGGARPVEEGRSSTSPSSRASIRCGSTCARSAGSSCSPPTRRSSWRSGSSAATWPPSGTWSRPTCGWSSRSRRGTSVAG